MPRGSEYALQSVARAIKEGLGPTRSLRIFREAGGTIRTQTWFRHFGELQASFGDLPNEALRPLNRRPTADEIRPFSTVRGRGFLQQVDVWVRDKATGEVYPLAFSVQSDRLISRARAVAQANDLYQEYANRYGQQVLGATYYGTYEMTPEIE